MQKKQRNEPKKETKLKCPVCRRPINNYPHFDRPGDIHEAEMQPERGDLTECDHCQAILEYALESARLTLQPVSAVRKRLFDRLSSECPEQQNTPELIEYARRYMAI